MIVGDAAAAATAMPSGNAGATLDGLLAGLAHRRPDAPALADPPNRSAFADGEPRRLSFAQADRVVTAIAARLQRMELPAGTVVAIQLPNIVENVLAVLGVLRAGMIAAPLPLLWRSADMIAALTRVGAKALISCGRIGGFAPAQLAMAVAAEVFSIRYLCGFGAALPDGVVPFDDLFGGAAPEPLPPREAGNNTAAGVAMITFDVGPSGIIPVAHSHAELCAGALAIRLEAGLREGDALVSTVAPTSFAGICLTLVSWLRGGGPLALHQPFDRRVLIGQLRTASPCSALILPGAVALELAASGALGGAAPACVLALWHDPARLFGSATWPKPRVALIDVAVFGEIGMVAARRGTAGQPLRIPYGPVTAPRGGEGAAVVGKIGRHSGRGTLTFRGPMAPHSNFPPGAEGGGAAVIDIGADGAADTGYGCSVNLETSTVTITRLPPGMVTVGGCRLPLSDLQASIRRIDRDATLTAVPDPLLGHRLTGVAPEPQKLQAALQAAGLNPLVVGAFSGGGAGLSENT